MVTGPLGRTGLGPCEITSSADWAGVHLEVELMGPCVRRHFREPDAGEKTEVYQVFHKTSLGEEQGASHAGSTPKLVFTDAHSAFIECCSVRDVLIRDSVGSTHGMFHSQSCGRAHKIPSVPRECMSVNAVVSCTT